MIGVCHKREHCTQKPGVKGNVKRRNANRKERERESISGSRDYWKEREKMNNSLEGSKQRPVSLHPKSLTLLKTLLLHVDVFREIL